MGTPGGSDGEGHRGRDPVADTDGDRHRYRRSRDVWAVVNDSFTDDDATERWAAGEVAWGLFSHPEATLGLLGGDAGLRGARVLELGCGTAYLSAWLARAGAHPVAADLSHDQLLTAHRCQRRHGPGFPLLECAGEQLPLAAGGFDLVVSEYGAAPWCEPARWLAEAARVLRPGGRLVFLTNSPLVAMCVPAEGGFAGDRLLRGPDELRRVEWPGGGVEHHPGHGEWIRELGAAGFVVDALHELHPRPGSPTHAWYDIVTAEWAQRWPAEDVWVAHRVG
jgi:SAM-dependent methyltransferase